jgi:hypothetical protein
MDKNIAVISSMNSHAETFSSSYMVNTLSKLANKKIELGDSPVYATVETDSKYVNLTIIQRETDAQNGIIANRHFIRVPNEFVR